jgi:hypothetical protein
LRESEKTWGFMGVGLSGNHNCGAAKSRLRETTVVFRGFVPLMRCMPQRMKANPSGSRTIR